MNSLFFLRWSYSTCFPFFWACVTVVMLETFRFWVAKAPSAIKTIRLDYLSILSFPNPRGNWKVWLWDFPGDALWRVFHFSGQTIVFLVTAMFSETPRTVHGHLNCLVCCQALGWFTSKTGHAKMCCCLNPSPVSSPCYSLGHILPHWTSTVFLGVKECAAKQHIHKLRENTPEHLWCFLSFPGFCD